MTETTRLDEPFAMIPTRVVRDSSLSINARLLYALLVSYARQDGKCYPSQARLAKDMGVTERTVRTLSGVLVQHGLVMIEPGSGRGHPSVYHLLKDGSQKPEEPQKPGRKRPKNPEICDTETRKQETHYIEAVELEAIEEEVVMRQPTDRPEPITENWEPSDDVKDRLASDCQGLVNLDRSLRRFRNYYIEKGTRSRAWDHKFEAWVLNDLDKTERETKPVASGPDEFGMMPWQHAEMSGSETREERAARIAAQEARLAAMNAEQPFEDFMRERRAEVINIDRARTA